MEFAPKRCEDVVLACVVLHNFMMGRHGGVLDDGPDGDQLDGVVEENESVISSGDMRDTPAANSIHPKRIRHLADMISNARSIEIRALDNL